MQNIHFSQNAEKRLWLGFLLALMLFIPFLLPPFPGLYQGYGPFKIAHLTFTANI